MDWCCSVLLESGQRSDLSSQPFLGFTFCWRELPQLRLHLTQAKAIQDTKVYRVQKPCLCVGQHRGPSSFRVSCGVTKVSISVSLQLTSSPACPAALVPYRHCPGEPSLVSVCRSSLLRNWSKLACPYLTGSHFSVLVLH